MKTWKCQSFHRLPFHDPDTLPLWLAVLQLNVQTPLHELRERDYRVCSEHFDDSDCQNRNKSKKRAPEKTAPEEKCHFETGEACLSTLC